MENYTPTSNAGKSPLSGAAQKLASDFRDVKSETSGLADRAGQVAKDLGAHACETFDDLKSAGRGALDDYAARGKRQISQAAGRISEYADNNTALIAGGAMVLGLLLGHVLTRKSD